MPEVTLVIKARDGNRWKRGMVVGVYPIGFEDMGSEGNKHFVAVKVNMTRRQIDRLTERFMWKSKTMGDTVLGQTVLPVEDASGFNATPGVLGQRVEIRGQHATIDGLAVSEQSVVSSLDRRTNELTLTAPLATTFRHDATIVALKGDGTEPSRNRRMYRRLRFADLLTAQHLAAVRDPDTDSPAVDLRGQATTEWDARSVHSTEPRLAGDI